MSSLTILNEYPKLRSVDKLTKNSKEVDFLEFFDSRSTKIFQNVRHRYHDVYNTVIDGFSHLRLFTKHLKKMIDASLLSANEYAKIVKEYRNEEPTLLINHTNNDTINVHLPDNFVNNNNELKSNINNNIDDSIPKKTDIDAFAEVFEFERRMSILLVTFWNRMTKEVYEPLYLYRKHAITKIEKLHENIIIEYDKLIKGNQNLRDTKVKALQLWNELCDARHQYRKANTNDPNSKNTKKYHKNVINLENKVTKIFKNVVNDTDLMNEIQNKFWNMVNRMIFRRKIILLTWLRCSRNFPRV